MLTCRQLVAQSSDLLDGELSFRQRIAVRAHLALCVNCRRFIRHLRVSQRVVRQLPDAPIPELERLLKAMAEQRATPASSEKPHNKH